MRVTGPGGYRVSDDPALIDRALVHDRRLGFTALTQPERWMERPRREPPG